MRVPRALLVFLTVVVAYTGTARAQQLEPADDSVRARIHTSLRAFYFNLSHRDWDALTADILAAKVVAHSGRADRFRMIHVEGRWRIVHLDLFREPVNISADR